MFSFAHVLHHVSRSPGSYTLSHGVWHFSRNGFAGFLCLHCFFRTAFTLIFFRFSFRFFFSLVSRFFYFLLFVLVFFIVVLGFLICFSFAQPFTITNLVLNFIRWFGSGYTKTTLLKQNSIYVLFFLIFFCSNSTAPLLLFYFSDLFIFRIRSISQNSRSTCFFSPSFHCSTCPYLQYFSSSQICRHGFNSDVPPAKIKPELNSSFFRTNSAFGTKLVHPAIITPVINQKKTTLHFFPFSHTILNKHVFFFSFSIRIDHHIIFVLILLIDSIV